ncbi:MAG: tetratricopeptide repeat protein [Dongiaceae bacterium]
MSDIFREVDEDIRRDQLKKLWDRTAPYVIGAAVLIVVATAGYRGWEYWQERQSQSSGDRFVAAVQLSDDGRTAESIAALESLVADGTGGYPILARFRIATEKAKAGDIEGAVTEFDTIAAGNAPAEMRAMARLRAAILLVDTASPAELETRVGDLAATGTPWRHTAREVLGLAAWRSGDYEGARMHFDSLVADQEAPQDLRQRVQLMLALVDARIGEGAAPADASETAPQN